ncbi:urea ABC transporter permease subunit UrtB [Betaproteobacteria bacterium SCN1]|jgi:urea transport system permease protein|nr:urea ABC transporter permease subunit UrtB [Betaproteobacteria bacterium SCN1]MBN8759334.1 urea ABC transporter permease subunit UrtB [Thiobacillus sp.]ODU90277.1 MAG: urea ABC transporter permease subunit UrtB [Thiobacillus sp. SCN 65-179]OJW34783.1 MAG: urea ABC transporter permease subunit UrtB [Thiobacillus sp. 65-69]
MLKFLLGLALCLPLFARAALDPAALMPFAGEDSAAKAEAVTALAGNPDPQVDALFRALSGDSLFFLPDGRVVVFDGERYADAATGTSLASEPESPESVIVNNVVRGALESAVALRGLAAADPAARLAAAGVLKERADPGFLPALEAALDRETDPRVKDALSRTTALLQLASPDKAVRLAAIERLGASRDRNVRAALAPLAEAETDPALKAAFKSALDAIDFRLSVANFFTNVFSGLSLGSILLLAALGLAITFGLMGIINMAHGEMLMLGAYTTYVVQGFFRTHFPDALDWYPLAALPLAFLVAAGVGAVLERTVIRHLYGRPLETLLATWGLSLILIQAVRSIFGPQNVEVANPSWMSGAFEIYGVVLPYNRLVIIGFAFFVLAIVWFVLNRTRMGLYVRGVMQNRPMADAIGVPTARVDMMAFALGSGIAGLGGVALSQIGNVGPELGQAYIIDSFMVVVLGGVGQLAGTVVAALGLGEINKFLEPYAGAVLGKIAVLVLIILFIQKRPSGLFALKGRSADA